MSLSTPSLAPLEALLPIFRQRGWTSATDGELARALGLSEDELHQRYGTRAQLVRYAVLADLERQKRDHQQLNEKYPTAVERIYGLIQYGLDDLQKITPKYLEELAQYPDAWTDINEHLASYSTPQLHGLLNEGIRKGLLRSDINIQLVTTIIVAQLNMMLDPNVFPPGRYNLAEVFRSVYLYYIRGLCTDEGARIAAAHFSRI